MLGIYGQFRNKITFIPKLKGHMLTPKTVMRDADLWAKFGNKFHSTGKNLIRGFGKGACGRQCIFVRQEDCLR
jgi:hypothetical protein